MSITRRHFLRGGTGIAVGLPFLEMFAPSRASADHVPKRVLVLATGFSMDINSSFERAAFTPTGDEAGITALSPILAPFEAYRDRMTVVGGLNNVVATTMSSNGHNASGKTLLTCYPTKDAFDNVGTFIPATPCEWDSDMAGPSFDHYLASRFPGNLLNLSIGPVNAEHRFRWQQVGDTVIFDEGVQNPQAAFDSLFGGLQQPAAEPTPLQILHSKRGSVLDAVLGEFGALRARAGAADRVRLDEHASMIRELEIEVGQVVQIVCDNPALTLPPNWAQADAAMGNEEGIYDDIVLRVMGQVAATALACQATQVASIHLRNIQTASFPWLNGGSAFIPANFHAVVHHDEGTAEQREAIFRWHAQAFTEIMDVMAATPDGHDTTLLDNTLVVWASSLRASSHSTDDLPVVLFGDLQGALRMGRVVDYAARGSRPLGDLWTTVLNAMDINDSSFGFVDGTGPAGEPLAVGPLTEVLS